MSVHVLLNLLNELGEKIRCEALSSILSIFPNEFNKLNNTGARMQDSIYHMTLKSYLTQFSHQKDRILPLEHATFYGRQHIKLRIEVTCIFNPLVDYLFNT